MTKLAIWNENGVVTHRVFLSSPFEIQAGQELEFDILKATSTPSGIEVTAFQVDEEWINSSSVTYFIEAGTNWALAQELVETLNNLVRLIEQYQRQEALEG